MMASEDEAADESYFRGRVNTRLSIQAIALHDNRAAHPARQRSPSGVALAQQRRRGRAAHDV
jgi:hypothetical protein